MVDARDTDTDTDSSSRLPKPLRSVTPLTRSRPNEGMDVIGWGMALGLVILVMPLLPFIIIVWLISKVVERVAPS